VEEAAEGEDLEDLVAEVSDMCVRGRSDLLSSLVAAPVESVVKQTSSVLDFVRLPGGDGRIAVAEDMEVVCSLHAGPMPFSFDFVIHDEGGGAHAVAGGGGFAAFGCKAGAAGVAFLRAGNRILLVGKRKFLTSWA